MKLQSQLVANSFKLGFLKYNDNLWVTARKVRQKPFTTPYCASSSESTHHFTKIQKPWETHIYDWYYTATLWLVIKSYQMQECSHFEFLPKGSFLMVLLFSCRGRLRCANLMTYDATNPSLARLAILAAATRLALVSVVIWDLAGNCPENPHLQSSSVGSTMRR